MPRLFTIAHTAGHTPNGWRLAHGCAATVDATIGAHKTCLLTLLAIHPKGGGLLASSEAVDGSRSFRQ